MIVNRIGHQFRVSWHTFFCMSRGSKDPKSKKRECFPRRHLNMLYYNPTINRGLTMLAPNLFLSSSTAQGDGAPVAERLSIRCRGDHRQPHAHTQPASTRHVSGSCQASQLRTCSQRTAFQSTCRLCTDAAT